MSYILSQDPEEALGKGRNDDLKPMILAVRSGDFRAIQILINNGVKIEPSVVKAAISMALQLQDMKSLRLLVSHHEHSSEGTVGDSILMQAIRTMNWGAVPLLLNAGVDPEYVSSDGECALSLACKMAHVDTVRLLCDKIVNIDPKNLRFPGGIYFICESKSPEIARIILNSRAGAKMDLNRVDGSGRSPFFSLVNSCKPAVFLELLEILAGPDSEYEFVDGSDLLIALFRSIKPPGEVISWLIERGIPLLQRYGSRREQIINTTKSTKGISEKAQEMIVAAVEKWI
jgi:ankyrin repeat protein